jgi:iron complex outermembrane receptor protein
MNKSTYSKSKYLKSLLMGSACGFVLMTGAYATNFDIPSGDLASALDAYTAQTGIALIVSDNAVKGARTRGVKGGLSADEALSRILAGTGFAMHRESGAVMIVRGYPKPSRADDSSPVHIAAAATPAASGAALETVTVTSSKIGGDVQNIPISITALSQEQLTSTQTAGGPDLVKQVPNMTFTKTNFTGYNIEIRGIGTQAISVTTDPAVAVAFNDIPFLRNHFFEQEFYDVNQVEVLRGPQGTLYGRNATAGVVNVIPAKPTDTYEAMLSADLGNYDNRRLEGMLNIPIVGDELDIRLAGEWTRRDGYTFDSETDTHVDGRDLWSGRMTIGWKPRSDIQTYFVWEHFSEDDDRLRSGKQLCKTDPNLVSQVGLGGSFGDTLSQGCAMTSLYSPQAFEVPDGYSLPYYEALSVLGSWVNSGVNPYASTVQSTNLRFIQSSILPTYRAKNDTLEFNADWSVSPTLTLTSQTGYNSDFLLSTEDYNRFTSSPGLYNPKNGNTSGAVSPSGVFCDPQLGCSSGLLAEDLSDEHAWQFSQEFRLSSNYSGPVNFSVGGNFLHYETEENYYVFVNAITLISLTGHDDPWVPGVSSNSQCLGSLPYHYPNLKVNGASSPFDGCVYIDPNPITSLNNEGHNYFLSQNPYLLNSYSGFGEAYYTPIKDLKFIIGARWTDDQKHFTDIPSWFADSGWGYPVTGVVNQEWDRLTGRFVANWTPHLDFTDQTLIYASVAHGYKAGGANPPGAELPVGFIDQNPTHPLTFKPEYIEAFELGSKNALLDSSLTLNGDVFYYNYTGYQISQIVDRTAINLNFNAHVEGAELETTWEPVPGLKFGFNGGYELTALAGGDQAIDLMDRTAGMPGWNVVKPWFTTASNCVLPLYVIQAMGYDVDSESGTSKVVGGRTESINGACGVAYTFQWDPVTNAAYTPYPYTGGVPTPGAYPGFNPAAAPNNGAGFFKNLAGNQLPNAPHFTTSLMAEYTVPVSGDWAATFHTDFYWQSQEWARVFEDPIDRIHGYTNVNLSLIMTSSNGWQVMAYAKNLFNVTAITGTFLNSDDSGLTTNVFLTDPRLVGVRVTKHLDESDGFWGSAYTGKDFFTGLFSDTDNGKPALWIEIGANFDQLDDAREAFDPPFVKSIPGYFPSALKVQNPPHIGLDWEGKLSYEPDGSDWVISADIRYGRTANNRHIHQSTSPQKVDIAVGHIQISAFPDARYVDLQTAGSEQHTIIDFMAGKDVGLGMFGASGSSVLSGGLRMADFVSRSSASIFGVPNSDRFPNGLGLYQQNAGTAQEKSSFHGIGPAISWDASKPVDGNEQEGEITVDWGANAAVLFGRQTANGEAGNTAGHYHCGNLFYPTPAHLCHGNQSPFYSHHSSYQNPAVAHARARTATVPNLGGFIGASMKYRNAKVSFGYRADEFFDAMDGGINAHKSENEGFFGPYANISIGLGG